MQKLTRTLALSAAFALALPALASADDWHGRGHGWGHGPYSYYRRPCAPVVYGPRVVYAPPVYAYPAPVVYAPVPVPRPVYVPAPVPVPVAVFPPAISVRTPHVAVTIGGWLPF